MFYFEGPRLSQSWPLSPSGLSLFVYSTHSQLHLKGPLSSEKNGPRVEQCSPGGGPCSTVLHKKRSEASIKRTFHFANIKWPSELPLGFIYAFSRMGQMRDIDSLRIKQFQTLIKGLAYWGKQFSELGSKVRRIYAKRHTIPIKQAKKPNNVQV